MVGCRAFLIAAGVLCLAVAADAANGERRHLEARAAALTDDPDGSLILNNLRKEHPRLLADNAEFARIARDPARREMILKLEEEAEKVLNEPPARYEIPDGKRLLATSRKVLERVQLLCLMQRLGRDPDGKRYLARAWRELETAARFKDWNPSHFLDTAEMTRAFAIGYDWLYRDLKPEQLSLLRDAIVVKGLTPALACYKGESSGYGWTTVSHNWNLVCNGGIGMGALAIADDEPVLAREVLCHVYSSLRYATRNCPPDGSWPEGVGYWKYATDYYVTFLAAASTALGPAGVPPPARGLAVTGWFPVYLTGPTGLLFNFADCGARMGSAPQMYWLAERFNTPQFAWFEKERHKTVPMDLLWWTTVFARDLPVARLFPSTDVVTMRSAWNDTDALFVGFKGGDNAVNHGHLDLGSFVLDALGKRWAVDLGGDDYNLPDYFGRQRWNYYRLRAEGHNTIVVNPGQGPDQPSDGTARLVRFASAPARTQSICLLPGGIRRGVALIENKTVLVQDEIRGPATNVWWFMHTPADVALRPDGRSAMLAQDGVWLEATLLQPANARFDVMDAAPLPTSPHPPQQAVNKGIRKLAIHLDTVTNLCLAVQLTPVADANTADVPPPPILPLARW